MLRAGRDTGSLVNHLMSRGAPALPQVGDGATVLHWTDRSAATVVAVRETPKRVFVTVQGDHARRTDSNGMSEMQSYEYTPNPDAPRQTFVFAKLPDGRLRKQLGKGPGLALGRRETYHDFSF